MDAIRKYWAVHHPNAINVLARKQRQRTAEDAAVDAANAQREPCNSFEGLSYAKQFNETVAEFLERMPPVPGFPDIDWLWVENPFPHQQEGDGKVQIGGDVAAAMMQMRMFDYGQKRAAILAETPDICASTLTKDLTNDRKKLRQFILDAARDSGDVSGKVSYRHLQKLAASQCPRLTSSVATISLRGRCTSILANHLQSSHRRETRRPCQDRRRCRPRSRHPNPLDMCVHRRLLRHRRREESRQSLTRS